MRACLTLACMAVCTITMLTACDGRMPVRPQSGGNPYEVVVVTDNDTAMDMITEALEQPLTGLPQKEKAFDISQSKSTTLNQATRYARSIVMVSIGNGDMPVTSIRYEKDAYAKPQILIHVSSATTDRLAADMISIGSQLTRLLNHFERADAISRLQKLQNTDAAKNVEEVTGCKLTVPADMTYYKRGKNFIWLTDNAAKGMQSICIYTCTGLDTSAPTVIEKRDSIMKANMPGEQKGMYMRTAPTAAIYQRRLFNNGLHATEILGQWEMEGDIMGGPFTCHVISDSIRNRTVVAEAFVYAPESRKRNLMKQLEAALYTLRLHK